MVPLKDATMQNVVYQNGDQRHWNITYSKSPNDWEEDSM